MSTQKSDSQYRRLGLDKRDLTAAEVEAMCRVYNARVDRWNYFECYADPKTAGEGQGELSHAFGVEWAAYGYRPCTELTSGFHEVRRVQSAGHPMNVRVPLFVIRLNRRMNNRVFADGGSFRQIYIDPKMMLEASVHTLDGHGDNAFRSWLDRTVGGLETYWTDWSLLPAGLPEECGLKLLGGFREQVRVWR